MASPNNLDMVSTWTFSQAAAFSLKGIVSVTTRLFRTELLIRSMAGPERTGCAQQA
jgi:hypothetical protein